MRTILTFILAFISISAVYAQIDSTNKSVQAIFYGNPGDAHEYKVTYNTLKMKGQDTLSNETIQYIASLSVLDVSEKSYTLEWSIKNYQFYTEIPILKALSEFNNNLKIVYRTNELGEYQDVINYPEIKEKLDTYIEEVKNKLTAEEQKFFESTIQHIMGTKDAFTRNTIQDIFQMHNFYGIKYSVNDTIALDVQVPNNFDGTPVDARFVSYLEELGKDTYTLISEQTVSPEAIDAAAKQYLQKVLPPESLSEADNFDFTQLQQISTLASQLHNSGWLLMSVNSKINTSLTQYKRDVRIIEFQSKE